MALRQLSPRNALVILTGLNLLNYLDRQVLSAVLPALQPTLHLNDEQGGNLATAFMIGYFVTAPFFGYLGDRASRKWLIAGGIFVWSLGTILTGFATSYGMMLAFRVLVGVGEASYATLGPSLLADLYGPGKRNNALTIFYVAIPVGSALGFVLGGVMEAHWGWRDAFLWAGLPGLVLALVMLPFAEPKRGGCDPVSPNGPHAGHLPRARDVFKLLKRPEYALVVLGYIAYTFALGAYAYWAPTFLFRVHGMSLEGANEFIGPTLAVAGLVSTFAGGFAATAWQRRNRTGYAQMLGWSTLVSAPLALAAFMVPSTGWCMVLMAATMLALFLPTGPVNTLILETVPANLRASAMALSIFMIHLFGDMWSSKIVGYLSVRGQEVHGLTRAAALNHAVLILPLALLVGAMLWLALAWKMRGGRFPADAGLS